MYDRVETFKTLEQYNCTVQAQKNNQTAKRKYK